MWTDHSLFWAVLAWMLLLAVLAFFAVGALLRADEATDGEPDLDSKQEAAATQPAETSDTPPPPHP